MVLSESLFGHISFKLGCNAHYKKVDLELISDADMY